jgi:hypothetical protein
LKSTTKRLRWKLVLGPSLKTLLHDFIRTAPLKPKSGLNGPPASGYRGVMAGKTLVISGFRNWLVAESVRFSPRKMVTAVSRKLLERTE